MTTPTLEAHLVGADAHTIHIVAPSGTWVAVAAHLPVSQALADWAAHLSGLSGETYDFFIDTDGLVHLESTEAFSVTWGTTGEALALGMPPAGLPTAVAHVSASTPTGILVAPAGVSVGGVALGLGEADPIGRVSGGVAQPPVTIVVMIDLPTWEAIRVGPLTGGLVRVVDSAGVARDVMVVKASTSMEPGPARLVLLRLEGTVVG